jgi:hypothetical protein
VPRWSVRGSGVDIGGKRITIAGVPVGTDLPEGTYPYSPYAAGDYEVKIVSWFSSSGRSDAPDR